MLILKLRNFASVERHLVRPVSVIRSSSTNASQSDEEKIVIPKRIVRGPTDLLMALSRTVGRDPTAPDFKFHDDPYLHPYSLRAKSTYALSTEAGRKTAQWVRKEHAELFTVSKAY